MGLTKSRSDDLAVTGVLVCPALEADGEDGEDGDAAHGLVEVVGVERTGSMLLELSMRIE